MKTFKINIFLCPSDYLQPKFPEKIAHLCRSRTRYIKVVGNIRYRPFCCTLTAYDWSSVKYMVNRILYSPGENGITNYVLNSNCIRMFCTKKTQVNPQQMSTRTEPLWSPLQFSVNRADESW